MRMGGAVLLAAAVLLSACSGDTDEPPATEVETSAATWTPEPTTTASIAETADRPLDSRKRPIVPAVTRTLRGDTATLDLVAVYRIAPDVVAVTGVLTPGEAWDPRGLAEAGWGDPQAPDFSAVSITVPDDSRVFLPLRTERGHCLCSPLRAVERGPTTVYALLGIPAEVERVSVEIADLGTFDDEEIQDIPAGPARAGLGPSHNLEVLEVRRGAGRLTATVRVENPTDDADRLPRGTFDPTLIASPGPCFRSLIVVGTDGRTAGVVGEEGCQRGFLPGAHRYVDLTLTLGDPMGRGLTYLSPLGAPVRGVTAQGQPALGDRDVIVGHDRYQTGEIEVIQGSQLRLRIPLSAVLAEPEQTEPTSTPTGSTPTETAAPRIVKSGGKVLDTVGRLVSKTEARRLTATVHTSAGATASERLARSREQAALIAAELEDRLGDEWVVVGTGAGSSQPLVAEGQLNDRIEIRLSP